MLLIYWHRCLRNANDRVYGDIIHARHKTMYQHVTDRGVVYCPPLRIVAHADVRLQNPMPTVIP